MKNAGPQRMAYFLDVDGTLADIRESPDLVEVAEAQRRALAGLRRRAGGAVAIVSGRSIAEIDRIFHGTQVAAAGLHGVERRDGSGRYSRVASRGDAIRRARDVLAAAVARHPGLVMEDKGSALALHYRRARRIASPLEATRE